MKKLASFFGNNWIPLLVGVIAYFVTDHTRLQALESWRTDEMKYQERQDQYIEQLKNVASKMEVVMERQETIIKMLLEERKGKQ